VGKGAKRRAHLPYQMIDRSTVGTLRFAHPTRPLEFWRQPTTESADRIHQLLHRNLQEVFGEATRSATALPSTSSGSRTAPCTCHRASLSAATRSKNLPVWATRHPSWLRLHAGRLAWGSGPHGEAPDYTGWDVIIVEDGRIAALYVFLDQPGKW